MGFVYEIENLVTGKRYIGKKLFHSSRRKAVKGRTRRKRVVKTSNWLNYWGSNKVLQEDVKALGEDKFRREILHLCTSKGECSYYEVKEQIDKEVLFGNYYNNFIGCRIHKSHLNGKPA